MSEYQYYEFLAVDQLLSRQQMDELRRLSGRAQITASHFKNTYNWGDFRGNPDTVLEKYFDAFLYVANWGTHLFQLRLPGRMIEFQTVRPYGTGPGLKAREANEFVFLKYCWDRETFGDEFYEDEAGDGWLDSLVSLRADLLRGDHRCLYLGWLLSAQSGELADDDTEPAVPAGLQELSTPLQSLVDFLRIDPDLLAIAAEASLPLKGMSLSQEDLTEWLARLPVREKDSILLRLVQGGDPHLSVELWRRVQQEKKPSEVLSLDDSRRAVRDLLYKMESRRRDRQERESKRLAKERARQKQEQAAARSAYLTDLGQREDRVWEEVEKFVLTKNPAKYDQASHLLKDLYDLSVQNKQENKYRFRLQELCQRHSQKPSFLRRLKKAVPISYEPTLH